jgi:CheY-like chemotaxis protein
VQRVLILDANQRQRAVLEAEALELGVDVLTAADDAAARRALDGARTDVLLLDPATPGAVALLGELRAAGSAIEVILVTAGLKTSELAELFKLRVTDYVSKPPRPGELRDRLRKLLEQRRRKQRTAAPGQAALDARPVREVLLAVGDDAERARLAGLLGPVTHVAAADAATLGRRARLYACRAVLVDPALPGLDWPSFARAARLESLLVAAGDPGGEPVDLALPRGATDLEPLLAALAADADPLLMSGNVLIVQRGAGGIDRWFRRAADELSMTLGGLGMARTPYAIVELTAAPRIADRLGSLVAQAFEWASDARMRLAVVGPPELKALLDESPAATLVPFFESVPQARDAARYFVDDEAPS